MSTIPSERFWCRSSEMPDLPKWSDYFKSHNSWKQCKFIILQPPVSWGLFTFAIFAEMSVVIFSFWQMWTNGCITNVLSVRFLTWIFLTSSLVHIRQRPKIEGKMAGVSKPKWLTPIRERVPPLYDLTIQTIQKIFYSVHANFGISLFGSHKSWETRVCIGGFHSPYGSVFNKSRLPAVYRRLFLPWQPVILSLTAIF